MEQIEASVMRRSYDLLEDFLDISKQVVRLHPHIVVILMHEYFRSMYPCDPYIKEKYSDELVANIECCLENNIAILERFKKVGSYHGREQHVPEEATVCGVPEMCDLFGELWQDRYNQKQLDSYEILNDLFKHNEIDLKSHVEGKNVIDMGCGSGRFSIALAKMGARTVTAIDINHKGLELGKKLASEEGLDNIRFIKGDILNLSFDDESFDFVFSKGVLHHTGDLKRSIQEYSRILKKNGKGFLYLYANGGIYWYSRKKMREVMQHIPRSFTNKILKSIGMPARRTIFEDSWYVPIEDHVTSEFVEKEFNDLDYAKVKRIVSPRDFELDKIVLDNGGVAKDVWGEGELRYFLIK